MKTGLVVLAVMFCVVLWAVVDDSNRQGEDISRNTASLGALWARVDSLQTLSEKNLP